MEKNYRGVVSSVWPFFLKKRLLYGKNDHERVQILKHGHLYRFNLRQQISTCKTRRLQELLLRLADELLSVANFMNFVNEFLKDAIMTVNA